MGSNTRMRNEYVRQRIKIIDVAHRISDQKWQAISREESLTAGVNVNLSGLSIWERLQSDSGGLCLAVD